MTTTTGRTAEALTSRGHDGVFAGMFAVFPKLNLAATCVLLRQDAYHGKRHYGLMRTEPSFSVLCAECGIYDGFVEAVDCLSVGICFRQRHVGALVGTFQRSPQDEVRGQDSS